MEGSAWGLPVGWSSYYTSILIGKKIKRNQLHESNEAKSNNHSALVMVSVEAYSLQL